MTDSNPHSSSNDRPQLCQTLRQEIERKDRLLGELNHRLKNTLAGIVGLLSVNRPPLSDEVSQWLDRSLERIAALAKAHELFSEHPAAISLAEMISRLVESLPLASAGAIEVETEISDADLRLAPSQAIPLAMALHEVCTNAIVHGCRGRGRLRIVCRAEPGGRIVVEVTDDADDIQTLTADSGTKRQGIGLQLVQGLVTGELGGQFAMHRSDRGGMIARIEFGVLEGKDR